MSLWNNYFKPMLLDEIDEPFNSNDYIFELKYDGMRALVFVSPSEFKILNRHLGDITNLYPELKEMKKLVDKKVIFDGEIICLEDGKPSFCRLQERSHLKNKAKINYQVLHNPVIFIGFDILFEGCDITNLPLIKRRERLNCYHDNEYFSKSIYVENNGVDLFNKVKKLGLEGIVAKRKNSTYTINIRSKEWIKIKNFIKEKFYVGGYVIKTSKFVISLLLGEYINGELYYVGNVVLAKKSDFYKKVIASKKRNNLFVNYSDEAIFIEPSLMIEVSYIERTKSNHLRQPFISSNNK